MKTVQNRAFGAPVAILNRTTDVGGKTSFQLPEDGYYHLFPVGEFPGTLLTRDEKGKPVEEPIVQVIDRAAIDAILKNPPPKDWLVDYEHFGHNPEQKSEAGAWGQDIIEREDGIWARLLLTDKGHADLTGGNYRYLSAECNNLERIGGNRWRILSFDRASLTNCPGFKTLTPLTNREQTQDKSMDYKAILLKWLGLKPEATDAEITAAVDKKSNAGANESELEALRTENRRLKTDNEAALNRQVDTDLETFKDVIADRDLTKGMLVANRDQTVKFLQGLKDAAAKGGRVYNRAAATPAKGKESVKGTAHEEFEVCVRNRMATEKCTYTRAYEDCKVLNRDKFEAVQKEDAAEDAE